MDWTVLNAQAASKLCCNTYHPTQQLFFCRAWSQANNVQNFFMFNADGTVAPFVPDAIGFGHVEMKPASVKLAPNSPFPFPGWTLGDIFVPNNAGTVIKITNGQNLINPWVQIPGISETTVETVFDATGTVYNGDLIVTFKHSVYRISPDGTPTLIVQSDQLQNYEGVVIVPNNPSKYGTLAGALLFPQTGDVTNVADKRNSPSGGANAGRKIAVVGLDKSITFVDAPCHADSLYIVDQYDQFYALDWEKGNIYYSSWDKLSSASFAGEILIQCEGGNSSPTGFFRLFWNGQAVVSEAIDTCPGCATKPATWEHFCVSRGAPGGVLPGGFSFCYYTSFNGPATKLSSVSLGTTIADNWKYVGGNSAFSFPATGKPVAVDAAMQISFVQDTNNQFYLQIVNGNPTTAGSLDLELSYSYVGVADPTNLVRIKNNPGDNYFWDGTSGRFTWSWASGTTGVVIGPMQHILSGNRFSFKFDVKSVSGVSNIVIAHRDGTTVQPMALGAFTLTSIACTCGNGVLEAGYLEQCDYAIVNSYCCTQDCQLRPSSYLCNATDPNDLCSIPSYCDGTHPTCPPVQTTSICNCTSPYYGVNCTKIRCDILSSCGQCNQYPECGWCCDSDSCVHNGACTNEYPRSCASCPANCVANNGTCSCGKCQCPAGRTGDSCELLLNCDGTIVKAGETPKVIDDCGVCGGNDTTCIGCDGVLYGPKYDACGVCGGNGSSCFNPCQGNDCESCTGGSEFCGWCSASSSCQSLQATGVCSEELKKDCPVPVAVIVGASIGAGVIAAIAVGGAAAVGLGVFGGKKGYDAYMKNKNNMSGASNNPMYNDSGRTGQNPFYN